MKSEYIQREIERLRGQIGAQRWDIRQLERAGLSTASAQELLARMQTKVADLREQRDKLKGEMRV